MKNEKGKLFIIKKSTKKNALRVIKNPERGNLIFSKSAGRNLCEIQSTFHTKHIEIFVAGAQNVKQLRRDLRRQNAQQL